MKLYGISGLGADESVFEYLNLDCELVPIEWIEPIKKETIEEYAVRFSEVINPSEKYGLIGVSFGGLVAVEISKRMNPELTILVSSAETKSELRSIYLLAGKLRLLRLVPEFLFDPPRRIAAWVFGAKNKELLYQIFDDTDLTFAKWAVIELVNWSNEVQLINPILKISGTHDKLILPSRDTTYQRLIDKGEHFMIVDRAQEISEIINEELKKLV